MKKILLVTTSVIVILVAIRFSLVKFSEYMMHKQMKESAVLTVNLKEVKEEEIFKSVELAGRVQSMDKVDLVARIDGYLQKKHFSEGDYVKKGQVLFTIEQTQYINALNQAKAQLENAKALYYKKSQDYNRGAELVKKDYISKSTYDGLYSDKKAAAASIKSAQAQLAEAQRNYSYTTIKAPVDGKIGSLQIQEGNYVTISSGILATITKVNPIYVRYSVDSKQVEELRKLDFIPKKGNNPIKVDVVLPNGEIYPMKGIQDFWDNQVSTSTGTLDFRATFENPENILIPGDFVKVKVYSNQKNKVLLIPQEFVLQDSAGRYVFVVDKNNVVQQKYFKDAGQYEKYWIVESGIEKSEKYVVTNITKIAPEMKVKLETEKKDKK